jgi:hypothetical protein
VIGPISLIVLGCQLPEELSHWVIAVILNGSMTKRIKVTAKGLTLQLRPPLFSQDSIPPDRYPK